MAAWFANFVKTGTPNGSGVPKWPESGKTRQVMHIDAVSKAAPEQNRARYEFPDSYTDKYSRVRRTLRLHAIAPTTSSPA